MIPNPTLKFFQKFRLPLNRGEQDVCNFLEDYYVVFKKELNALIEEQGNDRTFNDQLYDELRGGKETIYGFCQAILNALYAHRNGKILEAHQIFETKMTEMQNYIVSSEIRGIGILNHFYRIRIDKGDEQKDLFHIPLKERTKVRVFRYSIAGFPCLYLGGSKGPETGLSLAWLECGKPDKFYWSEFELADNIQPIELLDLTGSPFSSAIRSQNFYTWALNKEPFVVECVMKYIATYPLLAACSLTVVNKNEPFIPEYIIPQMLLLWVHNNNRFRGIKYFSCSWMDEARKYNAFNVVLPPKNISDNTHCSQLKAEFKLTKPDFVDVSHLTSADEKAITIMLKPNKREKAEFKFIAE